MNFKKLALTGLAATLLNLTGCAQVKFVYHGANYLIGNYSDYTDDHRVRMNDDRRSLEQKILSKAKLEVIGEGKDQVYVLYTQGTSYERGFQHGRLLKEQVRENIGRLMHIRDGASEKYKDVVNTEPLYTGYKSLEPFISDDYKEEMNGLADGAGLTLESVQFTQALGDIVESACSNYNLSSEATGGDTIQVRSLDFPLLLKIQENPVIQLVKPEKGHKYAMIGWAGVLGTVSGVSEEKIALGEVRGDKGVAAYREANNLGEKKETLRGIPMPFLLRDALQFDTNLDEVTERFRNASRTNCYVYLIGDGKTQNALAYLTDHELFKTLTEQDYQEVLSLVEPNSTLDHMNGVIFCGWNNGLLNQKIKENYGRINEEIIKKDINPAIAMKTNLQIVVYNLTQMTIQVANAEGKQKASNRNYTFLDLKEAFKWFEK
ncbi:hypothetical protein HZA97_08105 [Candidatus Woesearchaeota archaeon]|nr:hypothetical protein [Candidatus Woesearchaeota archaeon]